MADPPWHEEMVEPFDLDVTVLGGCGHAGLPLALALSDRGLKTAIYDISEAAEQGTI
jgi:UDP-N-acetyl-D-mannosaminuronic acid dehydrogenase